MAGIYFSSDGANPGRRVGFDISYINPLPHLLSLIFAFPLRSFSLSLSSLSPAPLLLSRFNEVPRGKILFCLLENILICFSIIFGLIYCKERFGIVEIQKIRIKYDRSKTLKHVLTVSQHIITLICDAVQSLD